MSLLVRKINKAKWKGADTQNTDVGSDAITICLKTSSNALSVWEIDNKGQLEDIILNFIIMQDRLSTFDVILIDRDEIEKLNFNLIDSPGNTPLESIIEIHRDITDLTYTKMGVIKDYILERIEKEFHQRISVGDSKKRLRDALENNVINIDILKKGVKSKVS